VIEASATEPKVFRRPLPTRMPPSSPGLSPGRDPMSLSTINLADDRRRGCDVQAEI